MIYGKLEEYVYIYIYIHVLASVIYMFLKD